MRLSPAIRMRILELTCEKNNIALTGTGTRHLNLMTGTPVWGVSCQG